ncbi:hypothetical protein, variant 1 [Aphanomyces invadans]|uniref:Serine protease n=1 Tax=Aphanomyces invadans TaxID=157072 RepID=A0A024TI55_9STRA|nr:hypothetical protein, variant 1 [Aphanomyces invadans]ETV93012.1 hypothetical protein, variant 1 [Aphanomyces invadans]RHY28552.1 hypothetical protein DYB32_005930 [Aphanomyces invadans]|eukprot:XP_008878276.1 hypothetical protein, variant 1 [Aphanomyces invadans]
MARLRRAIALGAVVALAQWRPASAAIGTPFDPHESMRLQKDGPHLKKLDKAFESHLESAFDPHLNLDTIEEKYEKQGIYFDDVEPLKPHVFTKAVVNHYAKKPKYWRQRYYVNEEHWGGPGFPVFLMIGGEAPIQPSDVSHEMFYMNTLAIQHKALLLSVEHRYYGESNPTPDMTVENLEFLTIDQALKDLELFHSHVTTKYRTTDASKWIVFGGSYPGNLAVWFKQEYPHLAVGGIASSAPLLLMADYKEYMEVVSNDFTRVGGAACGESIRNAMQALDDAIVEALEAHPSSAKKKGSKKASKHRRGVRPTDHNATLYDVLTLCEPIANDMDAMVLESIVKNQFQGVAQYNDFNPVNIQATCEYFASVTTEKPLAQLAGFLAMASPTGCYMSTFSGSSGMSLMEQPSFTGTEFDGTSIERQWTYQRCTELGYTQSAGTDAPNDTNIFRPLQFTSFNLLGTKLCQHLFGHAFKFPNVDAANKRLRGNRPQVDNITFTNGNLDPWYPLGVVDAKKVDDAQNTVLFIDGTSHCRDMYAPQVNDTQAIQAAHKQIAANVALYLS